MGDWISTGSKRSLEIQITVATGTTTTVIDENGLLAFGSFPYISGETFSRLNDSDFTIRLNAWKTYLSTKYGSEIYNIIPFSDPTRGELVIDSVNSRPSILETTITLNRTSASEATISFATDGDTPTEVGICYRIDHSTTEMPNNTDLVNNYVHTQTATQNNRFTFNVNDLNAGGYIVLCFATNSFGIIYSVESTINLPDF